MWLKLTKQMPQHITFIMLKMIINDLAGRASNEVGKYEDDRK